MTFKDKILESLVVYTDGPRKYLRFVPVEIEKFRHGLTINVEWPEGQEEAAKRNVAEYLAKAYEMLTMKGI